MSSRIESPHGELRFDQARRFLLARDPGRPLLLLAHTFDAGNALLRSVTQDKGAVFGWSLESLSSFAVRSSALPLAERELTLAPRLALEAVCVRVVSELASRAELGRLTGIGDRPGLPRALLRTFSELGMADVDAERLPIELKTAYRHYLSSLAELKLADRATVYRAAIAAARELVRTSGDAALCAYDLGPETALERRLLQTLCTRSGPVLITGPVHDVHGARTSTALSEAEPASEHREGTPSALFRLQAQLFSAAEAAGEADDSVSILSAPGESRECVEIVRRVLAEAERGVPFDRMAILLRSPFHYRTHLVEALRRANVPAYFSKGARAPEPGGRALLVLLDCAAEGLSATRFAEYLSLGVIPARGTQPSQSRDSVTPADEALRSLFGTARNSATDSLEEQGTESPQPSMPRRWESLLVDAAVVGGVERWRKRLDALEHERHEKHLPVESLRELRTFALPLIESLAALPNRACWGEWIDALSPLAERAIAQPAGVLAALQELEILRAVGPVELSEVRAVLGTRLGEVLLPPPERRGGELLVAAVDEARGRVFDVVFIPGLAEKLFPQRVVEDPLLPDEERAHISDELELQSRRVAGERLALSLSVGAARGRVVLSYPRFENDKARPRVPSFYALEALRAAEGRLPGFAELARRADAASRTRMGWPAPDRAADAIDVSEYDLSVLQQLLSGNQRELDGAARYLIGQNLRLARALQFRARRWRKEWRNVDGLVDPSANARSALLRRREALHRRGFAVTGLERYALCPYRFYLSTVLGLRGRKTTPHVEELDPATRGSLVHEMLRAAGAELSARGLFSPSADEQQAERVLDTVVHEVAAKWRDDLAPAIDRVWQDAITEIRVDLGRWLHEARHSDWQPLHFELAFGFGVDASGQASERGPGGGPVVLSFGLPLRGAVDLVEQRAGEMRATDYKTGTAKSPSEIVGGGTQLQPALYALVLERLFPDRVVTGGSAFYCSSRGEFRRNDVPLDERTRAAAEQVHHAIEQAFESGFFPAAPAREACDHCEFKISCGPYEAERVAAKDRSRLEPLLKLRRLS